MSINRSLAFLLPLALLLGALYLRGLASQTHFSSGQAAFPLSIEAPDPEHHTVLSLLHLSENETPENGTFATDDMLKVETHGFSRTRRIPATVDAPAVSILEIRNDGAIKIYIEENVDLGMDPQENQFALFFIDPRENHANIYLRRKSAEDAIFSNIGAGTWFYFTMTQRELDLREIDLRLKRLTDNEVFVGAIAVLRKMR